MNFRYIVNGLRRWLYRISHRHTAKEYDLFKKQFNWTHSRIGTWTDNNIKYRDDISELKDTWQCPERTFKRKAGDCEDIAYFQADILGKGWYIVMWKKTGEGHVSYCYSPITARIIYDGMKMTGWDYVEMWDYYFNTTERWTR